MSNDDTNTDPVRAAATQQAECLAELATELARRLNAPGPLPAAVIARALAYANKAAVQLEKLAGQLRPPGEGHQT
jgi:hypothetical protein